MQDTNVRILLVNVIEGSSNNAKTPLRIEERWA